MRNLIIRQAWNYRGTTRPRAGLFRRDLHRERLDILLLVLEARLRDGESEPEEVLSVLLDLTDLLGTAPRKVAARAASRARLLVGAGHTGALSGAAKKFLASGELEPQHPARPLWEDMIGDEAFYKALDTMKFSPAPLPEWLKNIH